MNRDTRQSKELEKRWKAIRKQEAALSASEERERDARREVRRRTVPRGKRTDDSDSESANERSQGKQRGPVTTTRAGSSDREGGKRRGSSPRREKGWGGAAESEWDEKKDEAAKIGKVRLDGAHGKDGTGKEQGPC